METVMTRKRALDVRIIKRVKRLKQARIDGEPFIKVIVTNRALARILDVTDQTISNWRTSGVIHCSRELAPGLFSYRMKNVIRDLEKHFDESNKQE